MKCSAPVEGHMTPYRASGSDSPRCQRTGMVWIMGPFGRRIFCTQHAAIWRKHYEIVNRIRSLR